jgi:hypothetical protein
MRNKMLKILTASILLLIAATAAQATEASFGASQRTRPIATGGP